jgi:hypothetical protein
MKVGCTPKAEEDALREKIGGTDILASVQETECKVPFGLCDRERRLAAQKRGRHTNESTSNHVLT